MVRLIPGEGWFLERMEGGDVRLTYRTGGEATGAPVVCVDVPAGSWCHALASMSGRTEPYATEAAEEFHLGQGKG